MAWTIKKRLLSLVLDFTIEGERVKTEKIFKEDEKGKTIFI